MNLNIRNGLGSRLFQAIQEVHIDVFDLIILTEANTTDQYYCCYRLGYEVVCLPMITVADVGAHVGV